MTALQRNGLIAIAVLLLARFIIVPWLDWVQQQNDQIVQLKMNRSKLADIQQKTDSLVALQQLIDQNYQRLSEYWLDAPADQLSVLALKHIEAVAKQHNIELSTRNTGSVSEGGARLLPVKLFVKGVPQNLFNFFHALESGQPMVFVTSVRLTKPSVAVDQISGIVDLQIMLKPAEAK